ncbi:MAG: TRAP transporter substrate-binding protein DctP [Rhodospirillaceae bacterium]|nr:TRAP transporter substrate-binding protein DctP [Rhodospirillaceae bacterium]
MIQYPFIDNVARLGPQSFTLKPFLAGELGPEDSFFPMLRRGRVQVAAVSSYTLTTVAPEFSLLRAPFLFGSVEEFAFVYDTRLAAIYRDLLAAQGLVHIQWMPSGWEGLYARDPVRMPGELKGFRLRVPVEPSAQELFASLGADMIQIPFAEVIPSLQTGLIDGGEGTVSVYLSGAVHAEAPHYTRTEHGLHVGHLIANARWHGELPARDRDLLREAYLPPLEALALLWPRLDGDLAKVEAGQGAVVHALNDDQRAAWRDAARGVTARLVQTLGGRSAEILTLIEDGKRTYAAQGG